MRRRPLPTVFRRAVHALVLVAGWAFFFLAWWHVLATQAVQPRDMLLLLAASLLIFPALTFIWVLHNRRIFRAKGPRTGLRQAESNYARDWAGQTVHADWEALRAARVVVIDADGADKYFTRG
ncbi:MAG: hypothetical protein ACK4R8_07190 [Thiobacillus sp.]